MTERMPDIYRIEYRNNTTNWKWDLKEYIAVVNDKHRDCLDNYFKSCSNGTEFRLVKSDFTVDDFKRGGVSPRTKELSNVL